MRWFVSRKKYGAAKAEGAKLRNALLHSTDQLAIAKTQCSHLLHENKLLRDRLTEKEEDEPPRKELCYVQ